MCKKIQFYYYTYLFSSVFSFNKSEDVITTYRLGEKILLIKKLINYFRVPCGLFCDTVDL